MRLDKIFNILFLMESQLDLSKFKVFGIDAWPFLRIQLVNKLRNNGENDDSFDHKVRIKNKVLSFLRGFADILLIYIFGKKKVHFPKNKQDVIFLKSSTGKRVFTEKGWYDVFFDPIIEYYNSKNLTTFSFETANNFIIKHPEQHRSYLIVMQMVFFYIKAVLFLPFLQTPKEFKVAYSGYLEMLKNLNLEEYKSVASSINTEFLYVYYLSNYFEKKLKVLKPKLVFLTPFYGFKGMALCFACKKLNIKVIDVQHGVQGKYHPGYGSYFSIPAEGYNVFPNMFLNWTLDDVDNINIWASKTDVKTMCIGNPIQDRFLTNTDISLYFDKKIVRFYGNRDKKVLITLQGKKKISEMLLSAINQSCDNSIKYLFRLHPTTPKPIKERIKKQLSSRLNKPYDLDFVSSLPIYAILRNVDLHITQSSSVVIEAALFNVKSLIINNDGKYYYSKHIESGDAFFCDSVNSLVARLESLEKLSFNEKATKEDSKLEKVLSQIILEQ